MKIKKIIVTIYLLLGWLFFPFYAYVSICGLYILVDNAYWSFRMNENIKGIVFAIISIFLLLFLYLMMLQETILKGLDTIKNHIG